MQVALDGNATLADRADAARRLAESDAKPAFDALLALAQEEHVEESLSRTAGESLAKVLIRSGTVDQVPLHEFTGGAYLGYDETVARRQQPGPKS